jgi:uncharacterized coiled-coil protein SlyX
MANEQLFLAQRGPCLSLYCKFCLLGSLAQHDGRYICAELDPEFDFETAFNKVSPLMQLRPFMQPMEMLRSAMSTPQTLKSLSNSVNEQEEVMDVTLDKLRALDGKQSRTQLCNGWTS